MMRVQALDHYADLKALRSLFSIFMVLDRDLRIIHGSDVLVRHMPAISEQPRLTQVFDLMRPNSMASFEDAARYLDSLFLLVASDQSFAIRGQMTYRTLEGQDYLVFCGGPWLAWLISNRPELRLALKDFSPQDAQFDQLIYMTTEKSMVEDLELLNKQLRTAKEEVEIAQAAKDDFFAHMSHEMRTPLNSIAASLVLMKEHGLTGRAGELLDLANKSSTNLMQVINYVLDISKLESSQSQLKNLKFDLAELITSVMEIVRARALEKGLELRSRIEPGLASTYLGDEDRLRQALLNLMINAIKFTGTGTISLNASTATIEDQTLRLEVTDTGKGISQQDQKSIFEPFSTLEPSVPDTNQQGTGLGLDISRRNVESMAGVIGVLSSTGNGSIFWIELPLPAVTGSTAGPAEATATVAAKAEFAGQVLLVDDNETNLMLGTMILEGMGVTVIPARSGEEAVEIATTGNPGLVLMDISMPGIDGFEATRRIRTSLDAKSLPVVAFTAYASSVEQAKSKTCGMNDYLTKPVDREKLAIVLEQWLPRIDRDESIFRGQPAPGGASTMVDQETLDKLLQQIGRDSLTSVISRFCDEADRRWAALKSAANKNDLAREAHTLASTCRSFGLPSVADKLNCVERHAKFGAVEAEPPCIAGIGRELTEGLLELKEAIARL